MKLVHRETLLEVKVGDLVSSRRGEQATVTGWRKPHKPASEGFVRLGRDEFYASVADCEWIEREDRSEADNGGNWNE